jgi:hypothetical protein
VKDSSCVLISGTFWAGGVDAAGICAMQSAVPIENERKNLNVRHIIVVSADCISLGTSVRRILLEKTNRACNKM